MWKKILRWAGLAAAGLAVVFAIVVATRDDPIGMMPGRALSGEVVTTPVSDWSFSDEHMLIAVETRPAAPHSVTTICFSHEGDLYVPADRGGSKTWTRASAPERNSVLDMGSKLAREAGIGYTVPILERVNKPSCGGPGFSGFSKA